VLSRHCQATAPGEIKYGHGPARRARAFRQAAVVSTLLARDGVRASDSAEGRRFFRLYVDGHYDPGDLPIRSASVTGASNSASSPGRPAVRTPTLKSRSGCANGRCPTGAGSRRSRSLSTGAADAHRASGAQAAPKTVIDAKFRSRSPSRSRGAWPGDAR
jgi:hypothetical protein